MQAATWALEPVARQRQEKIRQEAARCRRHAPRRPGRWRERLGWALVEVGLRLAVDEPRQQLRSRSVRS